MATGFFDNLKDYSEIKLRILGKFLTPWSAKLGYRAKYSGRVIWYVDGFAGRGKYRDGSDGSPLLGLRTALRVHKDNRGYELACFFVEKRSAYWRSLHRISEAFKLDGVRVCDERGEFSDYIPTIEKVTQDCSILLFVDPFGISPLKYHAFGPLLHRKAPLDVILTFQHTAVHRLAKEYPHLISEAIGSEEWLEDSNRTRQPGLLIKRVLDLFRDNLLADGGFSDVFFYPIRAAPTSAPKYYLVFASRHQAAFELWNDEVAEEESHLSAKGFKSLAQQTSFLPLVDDQLRASSLLEEVLEFIRFMRKTTREDIVMYFVRAKWGQYHTRDVKKAVNALIDSGRIFRDVRGKRNIDTDYLYDIAQSQNP